MTTLSVLAWPLGPDIGVDETHRLEAQFHGDAVHLYHRPRCEGPEIGPETRDIDADATTVDLEHKHASHQGLHLTDELDPALVAGRHQHRWPCDGRWVCRRDLGRGRRRSRYDGGPRRRRACIGRRRL